MSFLNFSLLIGNVLLEKQRQNSLLPLSEHSLAHPQGAEHVTGTRSVGAPVKPGQKCPVPEEQQCLSCGCCCRAGRALHRQTDRQQTRSSWSHRHSPLSSSLLSLSWREVAWTWAPLCRKFSAKSIVTWLMELWRFCGTVGKVCSSGTSKLQLLCLYAVLMWVWGVSTAALLSTTSDPRVCPWWPHGPRVQVRLVLQRQTESSGMVWPNRRAQTQPCQVSFSMALAAAGAEMPSAFPSTRSQFELYSSNNSKSSLYLTTCCPVCIYILITSPSSFFFFSIWFLCVCVWKRCMLGYLC